MTNFETFKSAYHELVMQGVCKDCSDKELLEHYSDAVLNYPALKDYWDKAKMLRYFTAIDDQWSYK